MTKVFPIEERFSLASQIKRAADGSTGQSIPEFKRFLDIALRSAIEVVACLYLASKRKYINNDIYRKYYDEYEVLCKMITKLRDSM